MKFVFTTSDCSRMKVKSSGLILMTQIYQNKDKPACRIVDS